MLLQEEYARRHGLATTLASHTLREGIALLRANGSEDRISGVKHILMTIRWVPHDRRPGSYQFLFQRAVHDSYNSRANFALLQDPTIVSYEEFDRTIRVIKDSSLMGYTVDYDTMAANLFLWEVFVCCYDGWLLRNANGRMMEHVEASLDPTLCIEQRHENFEAAISMIGHDHAGVYEKWTIGFANQRKKVIPWLGKMINGD